MERDKYGKIKLSDEMIEGLIDLFGPIKKVPRTEKQKNCNVCWGYGLHAGGMPSPMGPMDAGDGMPTQECPECGANPNPVKK